jgi:YidC/Oxa1 family membrane protein insertase
MLELLRILFYYPFVNVLTFFVWLIPGHNVAWGIIFLTLIVRVILLVPYKKQLEGQRKLQAIQPLINKVKEEHKDDKNAAATAQMQLMKDNNVNPFSSCLLTLIQLPILIILYNAIVQGVAGNTADLYAWLPRPDSIQTVFLGIDLVKADPYYIMPILAAILQFVQMKMVMPPKDPNNSPEAEQMMAVQRNMMYIFPFMTLYISARFPAGVALYWIVSTLFGIGQQYYVNKQKLNLVGVEKLALDSGEKQTGSTGKKGAKSTAKPTVNPVAKQVKPTLTAKNVIQQTAQDKKTGTKITVRRKGDK